MTDLLLVALALVAPLGGEPRHLDYVDPGTGSLIIQVVAAGLVGAALMVRRVRDAIMRAVSGGWEAIARAIGRGTPAVPPAASAGGHVAGDRAAADTPPD